MFNCEKLNVILRIEQNTQTRITNRKLEFWRKYDVIIYINKSVVFLNASGFSFYYKRKEGCFR